MRIFNTKDFGEVVRLRRKELGWTQGELSEYAGCSVMYISNLERGKESAEIGIALRVLATLGLDLEVTRRGER